MDSDFEIPTKVESSSEACVGSETRQGGGASLQGRQPTPQVDPCFREGEREYAVVSVTTDSGLATQCWFVAN